MKKIIALLLTVALCLCVAACGNSGSAEPTNENPIETTAAPTQSAMAAIEAYVNENKAALLSTMEQSFATSSGMTCTSDIAVIDNGIVIDININELENVEQADKDKLQATYNTMDTAFEELLVKLQQDLPEVEYMTININEKNGTLVASLTADGTVSAGQTVEEFVNANKADLLSSMEESFASASGYTCTSDIQVEGNGFIISININELNDIDQNTKDQMQSTYDGMGDTFVGLLADLQQMVPSLEYYTILVNEVDGDNLATITAGNK